MKSPPHWRIAWLGTLVIGIVSGLPAHADPIRTGFATTEIGPGNDDSSFGPVDLGFSINVFGGTYDSVYVNTNGNITFDGPQHGLTPNSLGTVGQKIIAPFFADVDTTAGNLVNYGQFQADGRNAFAVTWPGVGFFPSRTDLLNEFQLVLIDRSDVAAGDFDLELNYKSIQWETGGNSGSSTGLGGASARVGYSDGSGSPDGTFELPGSAVNGAFLDDGPDGTSLASNSLNSTKSGRYVFRSRGGRIDFSAEPGPDPDPDPDPDPGPDPGPDPDPNPTETPEPATLLMAGTGLLLAAGYSLRRHKRFRSATSAPKGVQQV